jgi:hypothetical protein
MCIYFNIDISNFNKDSLFNEEFEQESILGEEHIDTVMIEIFSVLELLLNTLTQRDDYNYIQDRIKRNYFVAGENGVESFGYEYLYNLVRFLKDKLSKNFELYQYFAENNMFIHPDEFPFNAVNNFAAGQILYSRYNISSESNSVLAENFYSLLTTIGIINYFKMSQNTAKILSNNPNSNTALYFKEMDDMFREFLNLMNQQLFADPNQQVEYFIKYYRYYFYNCESYSKFDSNAYNFSEIINTKKFYVRERDFETNSDIPQPSENVLDVPTANSAGQNRSLNANSSLPQTTILSSNTQTANALRANLDKINQMKVKNISKLETNNLDRYIQILEQYSEQHQNGKYNQKKKIMEIYRKNKMKAPK